MDVPGVVAMRTFAVPNVVVSRCIEFAHCRYNGDMISSRIVRQMKDVVEFIPVCPEFEIGLGIPRAPVRIVRMQGSDELVQPETGEVFTGEMNAFSDSFLSSLPDIDGFVLKNRSPSCGIKDVKVYSKPGRSAAVDKTAGLFAREVLNRFSRLPIEDEGRLKNTRIRDHFLTRIFAIADFRVVRDSGSIEKLARFHAQNKFLLMAYNQKELKDMGRIAANPRGEPAEQVIAHYEGHLDRALSRAPRYNANINVLLHALGHFSGLLSHQEKAFFIDTVEKYREGRTSICPAKNIIKTWIVRFDDDYLNQQTFFAPFPDQLMEMEPSESNRGRDYWA